MHEGRILEFEWRSDGSVFDRYNIVSETDIVDAARKIEAGARLDSQFTHSEPEPDSEKTQEKARKLV